MARRPLEGEPEVKRPASQKLPLRPSPFEDATRTGQAPAAPSLSRGGRGVGEPFENHSVRRGGLALSGSVA